MNKARKRKVLLLLFYWVWPAVALGAQIIEFPLEVELLGQRSEISGYVSEEAPEYWALDGDELFTLLQGYLTTERLQQVAPRFLERRVSHSLFTELGWHSEYRETDLVVAIGIPVQERKAIDLNFVNHNQAQLPKNLPRAEPARFSGVINAFITHTHNLRDTRFYGDSLALRTGMALGPVTLEDGHTFFRESEAGGGWQRDTSRLIYDIPDDAGFLQLGDYQLETDIQRLNPGALFGLSYSYQPDYLNTYIRPNRVPLTLESSALVSIRINGEEYRTLRLAPGQYNLRDLPVEFGVNEVEISYLDQSGLEVRRYYNIVDDPRLLQQGDWETQWVAGYWQENNEEGIKEFDNDRPALQVVAAYGLTPWWTLSPRIEWEQEQKYYGLRHHFALGEHFLSLDIHRQEEGDLHNSNFATSLFMPTLAWSWLENANLSYRFSRQHHDEQRDDRRHSLGFSAGINTSDLDSYMSFALGADFTNSNNDRRFASINTRYHLWGNSDLGLNLRWQKDQDRTDRSVFLSLSIPFGSGSSRANARSRYDSSRRQIESELSISNYSRQQSWRGSLNFIDSDYESLDLYYRRRGTRVNGNIRLTSRNESEDNPTRSATIGLETGLAWAGTSLAWTSPLGSSFTIVSLSDEMEGYALAQEDFGGLKIIPATEGGVRSALVNVSNRSSRRVQINAEKLDFDQELKHTEFVAMGGLRRGSAFQLSLLSGFFITGVLIDDQDNPLVEAVGEFAELEGDETYPFYTDNLGNFELDLIPAGDYELRLYDKKYASTVVTVDGDQALEDTFVDMKTIRISLASKPMHRRQKPLDKLANSNINNASPPLTGAETPTETRLQESPTVCCRP